GRHPDAHLPADGDGRPGRFRPHLPDVLLRLPRSRDAPRRAVAGRTAEDGMTILAAEDIVHHLLDYKLPGGALTAHQLLLIVIAVFMTVLFTVTSMRVQEKPHRTGIVALLEFTLVWLRDEVVYPWLGPERGRRY